MRTEGNLGYEAAQGKRPVAMKHKRVQHEGADPDLIFPTYNQWRFDRLDESEIRVIVVDLDLPKEE